MDAPGLKEKTMNKTENQKETYNPEWVQSVFKNIAKLVKWWMYSSVIEKTAEEIASSAILYALKPGLTGTGAFPNDKAHLFRTAKKFAKFAFLDEVKKSRKNQNLSLDDHQVNNEGEEEETSCAETEFVMHDYRARKMHSERMEIGRFALCHLDGFLREHGVSHRDIEVYKDRELFKVPTEVTCSKHDIKAGNLYKIVCIVNQIIERYGKDLIKDQ